MSFDDIPENKCESYPCHCGGEITFERGLWECNECEFTCSPDKLDKLQQAAKKVITQQQETTIDDIPF